MERMAISGSFFIASAIVVEILRSSFSSFKTSSSRRPFKIVSLDCSATTVELPKSWINSWAKRKMKEASAKEAPHDSPNKGVIHDHARVRDRDA